MTKVVVLLVLALVLFAAARLLHNAPCKRRGVLDDDGTQRGERWDGSWLSGGPRTALSLA